MPEKPVGKVEHYYPKAKAVAVGLSGDLKVGDEIHIVGHGDNVRKKVTSLQLDHIPIQQAHAGEHVGVGLATKVHEGDDVLVVDEGTSGAPASRAPAPKARATASRKPARKAAAKAKKAKPRKAKAAGRGKKAAKRGGKAAKRPKARPAKRPKRAKAGKAPARKAARRKAARKATRKRR